MICQNWDQQPSSAIDLHIYMYNDYIMQTMFTFVCFFINFLIFVDTNSKLMYLSFSLGGNKKKLKSSQRKLSCVFLPNATKILGVESMCLHC